MVTDVTGVDMVVRLCVIEMVKKEIWNQPFFYDPVKLKNEFSRNFILAHITSLFGEMWNGFE